MRPALRFRILGAFPLALACAGVSQQASTSNTGGTSSTCAAGKERCDCYGNSTCDLGLECRSNLCVAGGNGASTGTGGAMSTGGAGYVMTTGGATSAGGTAATGGTGHVMTAGGATSAGGMAATGGTGYVTATGGATSTNVGGAAIVGGASSSPNTGDRNMITLTQDQWDQINADSCSGWTAEGEMIPANIEFIVDTSGSMRDVSSNTTDGRSKWEITRTALEYTLDTLPRLTSVGLLLWPNKMTIPNDELTLPVDQQVPYRQTGGIDGCVNIGAMVPMDKMGAVGSVHRKSLAATLDAVDPLGGTPMADTYNYAVDNNYGGANARLPGKKHAVLITDGQPTIQLGCMGTGEEKRPVDYQPVLDSINGAYTKAFVRTFIIGSPGSEHMSVTGEDGRGWLSEAAIEGDTKLTPDCQNTGKPNFCHFDMSTEADFATGFSKALKNITGQVLSCAYTINDTFLQGQVVNPNKLNVIYQVNGSSAMSDMKLIGKASDPTCPEGNGWYLDPNDSAQETIKLCPLTCDKVQLDAGAVVNIRGGCETVGIIN